MKESTVFLLCLIVFLGLLYVDAGYIIAIGFTLALFLELEIRVLNKREEQEEEQRKIDKAKAKVGKKILKEINAKAPYVIGTAKYDDMMRLVEEYDFTVPDPPTTFFLTKEESIIIVKEDLVPNIENFMDYKKVLEMIAKWELPDLSEILDRRDYERIRKYMPPVEIDNRMMEKEEKLAALKIKDIGGRTNQFKSSMGESEDSRITKILIWGWRSSFGYLSSFVKEFKKGKKEGSS